MSQATADNAPDVELATVHPHALRWPASRPRVWPHLSFATDGAMLATALVVGGAWARATSSSFSLSWALVLLVLTLASLNRRHLHRPPLPLRIIDPLAAVLVAAPLAISGTVTLRVLLSASDGIGPETVKLGVLAAIFLGAGRAALTLRERCARRLGLSGSRALIVGAGEVGRRLAKRLVETPEFGLHPVGFLDK